MNHVVPRATAEGRLRLAPAVPSVLPATWGGRTTLLVGVATLLHWLVAATTGLSDTEAYYAQWARTPALSYYDHPPLVAWSAWVTTRLSSAPWAVRLGPVLYAAAFYALVYRLAARLFSPRAAFFAVAVLSAIPVFFFTGFLLNPEALLAPLWTLFLLLLVDLREHDAGRWRPLAIGAVIGVAFLAKYTAVLAVPVSLVYLAASARTRRWLRRPSLLLAGIVALAIATPVIVWNARHGWPSLQLHLSERMTRAAGESLGGAIWRVARGQLLCFSPLFQPALFGVLGVTIARSRRDERYRLLTIASLPVLAFLFTMMVRAGDSEPHWTMIGYLPLVVAAGAILDETPGPVRRVARVAFGAAFLLSGAAAVLYAVHVRTPALAKRLPSYDPAADPLAETVGWDRVSGVIADHAAKLGPTAVVVGAHNVLCGHLQAALDDSPAVYCASPRRTEFDFIGRRTPPAGAPVVFVDSVRYPAEAGVALPDRVCGPAQHVEIERAGLHQADFRIRDCLPLAGSL
jgi:4-amino-4-deoxy-L-arabinose transferase-like glycosyltransferase